MHPLERWHKHELLAECRASGPAELRSTKIDYVNETARSAYCTLCNGCGHTPRGHDDRIPHFRDRSGKAGIEIMPDDDFELTWVEGRMRAVGRAIAHSMATAIAFARL
jgi:hypothetical protein